jgi:hypothetical protein
MASLGFVYDLEVQLRLSPLLIICGWGLGANPPRLRFQLISN